MAFRYYGDSQLTGVWRSLSVASGATGRQRRTRSIREVPFTRRNPERSLRDQLARRVRVLERENRHLSELLQGLARERAVLQDVLRELD